MTNSRPSGRFHMGNFIKRDTCQPEEKLRDLMRRCTSWRDSACLVGTYTGNRLAQRLERVCVCVCVCVCGCVERLHPQECATTATVFMGTIPPVTRGYQTMEARWGAKGGGWNRQSDLSSGIKSNSVGIPKPRAYGFIVYQRLYQ